MYATRRVVLIATLAFAITGCKDKREKEEESEPGAAVREESAAEKPAERSDRVEEATKPVIKSFDPDISVAGLPDGLPTEIAFQFGWPTAPEKEVQGRAGDDTVLDISPPVPGELMWLSADRLVFRPGQEGFRYDTAYTVALRKVGTRHGVKKPEGRDNWTEEFTSPRFALRSLELEQANLARRRVSFVLSFSGPPKMDSLKSRVSAWVGATTVPLSISKSTATEVRLSGQSPAISSKSEITLRVASGVRSERHKAKLTQTTERTFPLSVPGFIRIGRVNLGEGDTGFYFDVFCQDEQQKNRRGFYDYHTEQCPVEVDELADFVEVSGVKNLSFSKIRHGFRVHGDIRYGQRRIVIKSGLNTQKGSLLTRTFERQMNVPRRTPRIRFVSQGRYLPRSALSKLPVKHVNLEEVTLEVRQIHRQNLTFWLTAETDAPDDRVSDVIATRKFRLGGEMDVEGTSWLQVQKVFPEKVEGAFQLALISGNARDTARLVLTDLAIVAKRAGKNGQDLMVWVLDTISLQPVQSAKVELYTRSNRVVATGKTDSAGASSFREALDPLTRNAPFAVMVSKDDDQSFLEFADLRIPLGDENVQGKPYQVETAYQAAIYSDRGVYRPGETAHLAALVRDAQQKGVSGLPLVAKVYDPRSKMVKQLRSQTNVVGMAGFDVGFQSFAPTGHYNFKLEAGGKVIETYTFNVEEFMPERMKVKVQAKKSDYLMTEQVEVDVSARYLFGSKASGEKVELTCSLHPSRFKPNQNAQFTYGPWSQDPRPPVNLGKVEGELDKEGARTMKCPVPTEVISARGPSKVIAMASVFESGSGRTTVSQASVPVHPAGIYVGLTSGTQKTSQGKPVTVDGIVVDWEGKPRKDVKEVSITLYRLQAEYNYDYVDGRNRWKMFLRKSRESSTVEKVRDSRFRTSFTPSGYSQGYLVHASVGEAESDLHLESDASYYWQPRTTVADNTPRPERPTTLLMEVPGDIQVGKTAKATIKPPFPGKLLFSVETDRLIESRWMDVDMKETTVEFELDEFTPNVYVSGLLIKNPRQESSRAFMPGRAFGVKSIRVKPTRHELGLQIQAPSEVRPNSTLKINLDVQGADGKAYATVAAVDEGILQLTRFKSPDVLAQLFARRALGVSTFETIGWTLLLPPSDGGKSPGGDEEGGDGQGRIAPVKPVALWSGIVEVNRGRATVEFEVPQYRGELRIMAVAASADRSGSASSSVTVRDPLVLQATLPRFLLSGDRFVVPVFLTNMTGRDGTFKVQLEPGEGIELDGQAVKDIQIRKGAAGTVTFLARSNESFGAAKFKVLASGNNTVSRDEVTIPFLPNAPVTRESQVVELKEGQNDIRRLLAGWKPQTEQTSVWVTSNRYGKELGHLKYLIRYPYG